MRRTCLLYTSCARLGIDITVITPPGYEPDAGILRQAEGFARRNGCQVQVTNELEAGLQGAEAVYTDEMCIRDRTSREAVGLVLVCRMQ